MQVKVNPNECFPGPQNLHSDHIKHRKDIKQYLIIDL